ncbi:hypothetical protein EGW08_009087 [Elysia chlorotica]|uniref:Transmembrane protein n=1 Tax=Elysia chlorotica TaxID=188477 RepID=A0A3S1BKW5_ELYCH|nr:hypothetical protein EGW08_009087 [Elysia chlorotica]
MATLTNMFGKTDAPTHALGVRQSPGGYFYFWNLLVPLSVLLNVHEFGLGLHEAGLMLALSIGPHIFEGLVQNTFLLWVVQMFLFIWIERIMWRWPWYQIYSCCFARTLFMALALIAIPSILIKWLWYPLYNGIPRALNYIFPDLSTKNGEHLADAILLIASVLLLMHSLRCHRGASTKMIKKEETTCCWSN